MAASSAERTSQVAQPAASIPRLAAGWVSAAGTTLKSTTALALAEARLAASSLLLMLWLGAVASIFVLGAWGLMVAGLVLGLTGLGLAPWAALLVLALLHAVVAAASWQGIVRLSAHLKFSHTREHLSLAGEGNSDVDAGKAQG